MKTEFMAAPGSRLQAPGSRLQAPGSRLQAPGSRLQRLQALRPQERGSSSKRNLYRLFWTAAAAIAVAVSVLVTNSAIADGSTEFKNEHYGGACNSQYKVGYRNTECLSAWWDNTPPASTGYALGSTFGAENKCSDYGDMKAHVDTVGGTDVHFHLDNGVSIEAPSRVPTSATSPAASTNPTFATNNRSRRTTGK